MSWGTRVRTAAERAPTWHSARMHREEREFSIVLHLSAEFDEAYTGDDDGYAWHERFEHVLKPRLVAALFEVLRADPSFGVVSAPRGRDPERALELDLVFKPRAGA
jgi:hypothetical protein